MDFLIERLVQILRPTLLQPVEAGVAHYRKNPCPAVPTAEASKELERAQHGRLASAISQGCRPHRDAAIRLPRSARQQLYLPPAAPSASRLLYRPSRHFIPAIFSSARE
jgi:hypothetical protein